MKCPYCGSYCADTARYCPSCKQPLPGYTAPSAVPLERRDRPRERRTPWQKALIAVISVATVAALGVGFYKLTTMISEHRITRLYTRGSYTPQLSTVTMSDLRQGHAIVFYGKDGDQVFIPELNRSLSISGGVARVEVADSDWFGPSVADIDYADVTLTPMLISEKGGKTPLPPLNFQVEVPESPLKLTSPAADKTTVVTSVYPLIVNVVPGSTLFVNGQDVTGSVDRSGLLSTNVQVEPIGDNLITLIARTPKHREVRKEIVIYREHYDIEIELDTSVSDQSSSRTMAITGKTEPGAIITVDTDYMEESLSIDMETGRFNFVAKFSTIGENVVRFRASMEGRKDAEIRFVVNYLPSLSEISSRAWAMDYTQLKQMYEQWNGRFFACNGEVIDIVTDGDVSYVIMDVGDADQQLLVLENRSSTTPTLGRRYLAYADVSGQHMYKSNYYPMLIARYMDVAS